MDFKMGKSSVNKLGFSIAMFDYQRVFGITLEALQDDHIHLLQTDAHMYLGIKIIKAYQGLIFGPCITVSLLLLGSHLGTHKKPPNMALDEVMLVMLMINDNNRI